MDSAHNIDGIVKSRFKDWIPAFAGMTPVVSTDINCIIVIPAKAGIQKNGKIRLFTKLSILIKIRHTHHDPMSETDL